MRKRSKTKSTGDSIPRDDLLKSPPGMKPKKVSFEHIVVELFCSYCGSVKKLLQIEVDYSITDEQLVGHVSCVCGRSVILIFYIENRFEVHLRCDIDSHYYIEPLVAGLTDILTMKSVCPVCHRNLDVIMYRPSEADLKKLQKVRKSLHAKCDNLIEVVGIRDDMTLVQLSAILKRILEHVELDTNFVGIYLFEDSFQIYFNGNIVISNVKAELTTSKLDTYYSHLRLIKYDDYFEIIKPQFYMMSKYKKNVDIDFSQMISDVIADLFYKGVSQAGFSKDKLIIKYFADVEISMSEIQSGYDLGAKYSTTSLKEFLDARVKDYILGEHLGSGVSANVFKGQHVKNRDKSVAIKIYRPWIFEKFREQDIRFEREFNLIKSIKHPGVISVLDKGVVTIAKKLRHYLIMEFINGSTLANWRKHHGELHEAKLVALLLHISRSLQVIHDVGIYHRDLKPENIMVDGVTLKPIIMDFGVMKVIDHRITETGQFLGTKLYSPPEYLRGDKDINWELLDTYCLGGIAYYLIEGVAPWQVSQCNIGELIKMKMSSIIFSKPISHNLKTLVESLLSPKPHNRPPLHKVISDLSVMFE